MAGEDEIRGRLWNALCGSDEGRCVCWVASTRERDAAVSVVRELVRSAPCHVVICLDSPHRLDAGRPTGVDRRRPMTPELIRTATSMLRKLYGPDTDAMVLLGEPLAEIRRYVRTQHIDLVVMGEQAIAIENEYHARLIDDPPCPVLVFVDPDRSRAELHAGSGGEK